MSEFTNKNDMILKIRLTEAVYAKSFIEKGQIKFNTPQNWVNYSKTHQEGRGDYFEGAVVCGCVDEIDKIVEFYKNVPQFKDRHLIAELKDNRKIYRDKQSMQLPCFCFYLVKVGDLEHSNNNELTYTIPRSYIKDFVDHMSDEEIAKLEPDRKPAIITISNFGEFKKRMCQKLKKIGVEEQEVIISEVAYRPDGDCFIHSNIEYPRELFIKNNRFSNQKEVRIIINTKNKEVLKILENPIEIGCLEDIAYMYEGYFPEGLKVKLKK